MIVMNHRRKRFHVGPRSGHANTKLRCWVFCFDEAGWPRAGIGSRGGTARAISWQALVNIKISCTLD